MKLPLLSLLALSLAAVGCGGSSSSDDGGFAVAPATGTVTQASASDAAISGYNFSNEGTGSITLTDFEVDCADGKVVKDSTGIGLDPGQAVGFLFDPTQTHVVSKFSFRVEGSTEKLVVTTDDKTGHVPSAGPNP